MSDGTAFLRFLDPAAFSERGARMPIRDAGVPITQINELEWVAGEIYANVWQTDFIARISPTTGQVLGWIDLSGLLSPSEAKVADVLNGIAFDADRGRLLVTGKLWPSVFEVEIRPR